MARSKKICTISDCGKRMAARGWCTAHYWRWQKYGDPAYKVKEYEYHGLWKHPLYPIWRAIKERTLNPNNPNYKHYGGRGVTICSGWKDSFSTFLKDVGERPEPSLSIDRIDNDGNYSCGNCKECLDNGWPMNVQWSTKAQQSFNTRLHKTNKTGYRGVCFQYGAFVASISVKDSPVYLGRYKTAEEAAVAYNIAALQYRGADAKLNKVR